MDWDELHWKLTRLWWAEPGAAADCAAEISTAVRYGWLSPATVRWLDSLTFFQLRDLIRVGGGSGWTDPDSVIRAISDLAHGLLSTAWACTAQAL